LFKLKKGRKIMKKLTLILTALVLATSIFAATNDVTLGGSAGYSNGDGAVLLSRTIDFSSATVGTSNDVYQLITVPAGTLITSVGYVVEENEDGVTGEDSTLTIDIGDGTDADGWTDGANVLTGQVATAYFGTSLGADYTAVTITNGTARLGYTMGKFYTAVDTIDLTLTQTADTAKITVRAIGYPIVGYK
jgi:hypothetical protein